MIQQKELYMILVIDTAIPNNPWKIDDTRVFRSEEEILRAIEREIKLDEAHGYTGWEYKIGVVRLEFKEAPIAQESSKRIITI